MEIKEPLLGISSSHFFLPLRESSRLSPDPWMVKRVFSIYEALQRHLRVVDGIAIGHNIKPRQESIVARAGVARMGPRGSFRSEKKKSYD